MKLKFPKVIEYTLFSLLFTLPVAWLGLYAVCWNEWLLLACRRPLDSFIIVTVVVVIVTLGPIGWSYHERAMKRARRGMWAKAGPGFGHQVGQAFERMVKLVIEPQAVEGQVSSADRFEARGWWCWVEVDGGRTIWVDRGELWQWLLRVERLNATLRPGESAIGQRRWEAELGRELWMAYCDILEMVGGVEYPTGDPRSRRYVSGAPWGRIEKYEQMRPSEVR